MKKIKLTNIIIALGMFMFALPVMAATTASLSPASINVTAGKSFNVIVSVNPQGTNNYAEKLQVNFPSSNLQVTSLTLGSNWMALTQSGYDSTDNINGVLIKTAGYPAGFSGPTTFGTITFTALKSGSGNITIGNSSLAFEVNSQDAITGTGTAFTISAGATAPTTKTTTVTPTTVTQPTVQTTMVTTPTTQQAIAPTTNNQVAAAVVAAPHSYAWLWWLLLAVVVILGGWWIVSRKSSKKY